MHKKELVLAKSPSRFFSASMVRKLYFDEDLLDVVTPYAEMYVKADLG